MPCFNKDVQQFELSKTFYYWEFKLISSPCKTISHFLANLKICIYYNLTIPLLGICHQKMLYLWCYNKEYIVFVPGF